MTNRDIGNELINDKQIEWPTTITTYLANSDEKCFICCKKLNICVKTTCEHYIHADCLQEWENESNMCPICHIQLMDNPNVINDADYEKVLCNVRKNITAVNLMRSHNTHQNHSRNLLPGHVNNIAVSKRTTKKGQKILDDYYNSEINEINITQQTNPKNNFAKKFRMKNPEFNKNGH